MIQVHPGILLHPMILLRELFQRPHLFGRTRTGCPWGSVRGLSFPLEGVHGIPTSLRFHISVDIYETSRPPGYGQRPPSGRRRQGGVKELCQHQWEWPSPLLPPLTPLHLPLASSNLLPLWPGLFLRESPNWQMAGIQAQSVLANQHV